MTIKIVIENPHDPANPTQMTCTDCESLDEAVSAIYLFVQYCRIIRIEVIEDRQGEAWKK